MTFERLFERPDQFLLGFDGSDAVFVRMDREAYHRSIFCDQRISPADRQLTRVACSELFELCTTERARPRPISWIFHVAHCGSTLLARALDVMESNIVCREPMALRQLGVDHATNYFGGEPPDEWRQRLHLVAALLGRSYKEDTPSIVKGNVPVNFIIPQLLELHPESRAILLYFSFENYLLAILRTPGHREWVMTVANQLTNALRVTTGANEELNVQQVAACLWLAQMRMYDEAISEHPGARSLDAEVLFNDPRLAIRGAFEFFGQPCDESRLEEIVTGELFTRYSKDPEKQFTNESRLARRDTLRNELASELAEAREWLERQADVCSVPDRLARPLVGESADLLSRG